MLRSILVSLILATKIAVAQNAFLENNCYDCHDADSAKGGLNLEELSTDLSDPAVRERWVFLHDRVAKGEMPPEDKKQPDRATESAFLTVLGNGLTKADLANREVILRRLTRQEYENTVRDLFGTHVDVQRFLPDDSVEQGFENIGSDLGLSAQHLTACVSAADEILDRVFGPEQKPRVTDKKTNPKDSRYVTESEVKVDDGIYMFSRRDYAFYGDHSVAAPGHYRARLKVRAVQSDVPVVFTVKLGRGGQIPGNEQRWFSAEPDKTKTIEFEFYAPEAQDRLVFHLVNGYSQYKVPQGYEGPGLFLGDTELFGPLESWPPESRAKLLGGVDPATGTLEDLGTILQKLLPRAFRREPTPGELERYVVLAKSALDEGLGFVPALRRAVKGVLCAPELWFLEEPAEPDGYALASRLSYMLWRSMPDDELFALAKKGELSRPNVLRAQVERMLGDEKSQRFVETFTGQWLRLRDIDFTVPNRRLYPEFNQLLRFSMLEETRAFFREILDRDHGVRNFIDSDFAMLNQPIAEFYGIEGVRGIETRRVELPEGSVRGGVLTQASVLKVSADGTRTSPVLRGVWILKHFFGEPSPPPPPSVDAVEPDIRGAETIREALAKHREHASCSRCHRNIDPPGFALERFDVIGGYRDWYRSRQGKWVKKMIPNSPISVQYRQGPDVDDTGTMPDGRPFAGIREYKALLLEDEEKLARSLTRMLLTYGLGRHLGFSDRAAVDEIVAKTAPQHGLRSVLHEVIQSETFRSR